MKKIYTGYTVLLLMLYILFITYGEFTGEYTTKAIIILLITTFLIFISFIFTIRKVLILEWERRSDFLDQVIQKRGDATYELSKETLFSKEQRKIKELVRILDNERSVYEKEKESIQSLVTDLSHQIKTPLANISMYTSTLLERDLTRERQIEFLSYSNSQIIKLQWLMDALIKISRLETEIIHLNKGYFKIEDTLATAVGGVYGKAMDKNIDIKVECKSSIKCYHDMKWTSEAIFNILENAVKYSDRNGVIIINVDKWENFTRVNIKDNGIGIDEKEVNNIFKRFYRGKNVSQREGAGIGLFLAREIVQRQGGYITVKSKVNKGTTFSIFLLNK
ncbi:MAG: sensor histidine kinase [Clostridium sp.]